MHAIGVVIKILDNVSLSLIEQFVCCSDWSSPLHHFGLAGQRSVSVLCSYK